MSTTSLSKVLTNDLRLQIITWFAQGYTVRRIKQLINEATSHTPSDQEILQVGVLYSDDIEGLRKEIARDTLMRGLARKEERIRRLEELAEQWEDKAESDSKSARTYLAVIKQIQSEVEPLGIRVLLDEEDPWLQLLSKLALKAPTEQL